MNINRRGESCPIPFRRGRFYWLERQWYATTREGDELGPYATEQEAQMGVACYLAERLSEDEAEALAAISTSDPVDLTVTEIRRFNQEVETSGVGAALDWARRRIERIMKESLPPQQRRERISALEFLLARY